MNRKNKASAFTATVLLAALTAGGAVTASAALVEDPTGSGGFQSVFNAEGTREIGTAQMEAGEFNLGTFGYTQLDPDLVPADDRWAFLGEDKVPAGLNQTYANDYRFTLTNNDPDGEPLTLESWKAQHRVPDEFFGDTITPSIAPGTVYRMPQPEQPLTVQAGETVTVELPAPDIPLAAYVAQDASGDIYEIGSIIRWTFVIEGNEFWFEDRLRIFGGDDINNANAPLFMHCDENGCETPSVFYERALSGSAFFADWAEPVEPQEPTEPAQPVEPAEPQPEVPVTPPAPPVQEPQEPQNPEEPGQGTTPPVVPVKPAPPKQPTPGTPTVPVTPAPVPPEQGAPQEPGEPAPPVPTDEGAPEAPEALHPSPVDPPTASPGEPDDGKVWTSLPQRNVQQPQAQEALPAQPQQPAEEPAEEVGSFITLEDAAEASRIIFIPLVLLVFLLKGYLWFHMLNRNRLTLAAANNPYQLNMNQVTELHKLNTTDIGSTTP